MLTGEGLSKCVIYLLDYVHVAVLSVGGLCDETLCVLAFIRVFGCIVRCTVLLVMVLFLLWILFLFFLPILLLIHVVIWPLFGNQLLHSDVH